MAYPDPSRGELIISHLLDGTVIAKWKVRSASMEEYQIP